MKKQVKIPLYGILDDLSVAKTHQAADVVEFHGDNPIKGTKGYFKVTKPFDDVVTVETPRGTYHLKFNKGAGIYTGEAKGLKVHVSLKKIVGELIYWA